jgi:hypothetical protein
MGACPGCGTTRTGRFCEQCGHDFADGSVPTGTPRPPTGLDLTMPSGRRNDPPCSATRVDIRPRWTAEITADRGYFDAACWGDDGLVFPSTYPSRSIPLDSKEVRIGRRSASRGLSPEIDLSGEPADPGISHLHAVLIAGSNGAWQLVDPGSTNGTTLNGATEPLAPNVAVPVGDGDRIHLGAWTTITLRLVA